MKRLSHICAVLMVFFANSPVHAGYALNGKITHLLPADKGTLSFIFSGTHVGAPSCATTYPNHWMVDVTTINGQALAAAVITAFTTGNTLDVYGNNVCKTLQPDQENVGYLVIYKGS